MVPLGCRGCVFLFLKEKEKIYIFTKHLINLDDIVEYRNTLYIGEEL